MWRKWGTLTARRCLSRKRHGKDVTTKDPTACVSRMVSPCRVLTKQCEKLSGQGKAGIFRAWLMMELRRR